MRERLAMMLWAAGNAVAPTYERPPGKGRSSWRATLFFTGSSTEASRWFDCLNDKACGCPSGTLGDCGFDGATLEPADA